MSLGKDLASIRKSKNLTLEDIQAAIKIPPETLRSIENESIFSDTSMNQTYLRSFVRSYAKVLKIPDEEIVQALDEMEAGTYSGFLYGKNEDLDDVNNAEEFTELDALTELNEADPVPSESAEDTDQPTSKESATTSDLESVNWADMGRKFTMVSKSPRIWLPITLFVVIAFLIGATFVYWNDISEWFGNEEPAMTQEPVMNAETDDPMDMEDQAADSTQANEVAPVNNAQQQTATENVPEREPITLGDTLTMTVYAAYGQLEPVRITSDMNWTTNPFWMEEGEAYYFDFKDTLLVRGQYSRLLLLFNGHVIENPRQNYFNSAFNSIMITRSVLDQPQYLAPAPLEFPLEIGPPDSTVYRIRF